MNYKKIIVGAYIEKHNQGIHYVDYFIQEAQKAKRDEFVKVENFLNACKTIISKYRKEIENKYHRRLHENDRVIESIKSGRGLTGQTHLNLTYFKY
jgi:hypothetical protein